ncbi:MAG TPA: helix-turn-helix domain-containing protein [Thermomicrobiales bacterium]|nr:helix-turn-helix domain-containing protein [Thermomicrobiales bacterium]
MPEDRDLLTVSEAAAELGLSPVGVARRLQRGYMRGIKVSPRLWLVEREEVERAKQRGRMKPGPKPKTEEQETGRDATNVRPAERVRRGTQLMTNDPTPDRGGQDDHQPFVFVDELPDGCRILIIHHATVAEYDAIARGLHGINAPILEDFDAALLGQRVIRHGGKTSPYPDDVRRHYAKRANGLKQKGRTWEGIGADLRLPKSTLYGWWKEFFSNSEKPDHTE